MLLHLPLRFRPSSYVLATFLAMLCIGAATVRAERPPAPQLLPETTVALLSITDAPELVERFGDTAWGRMGRDPQLEPLVANLYGSLNEAAAGLEERLGVSLPELLAIPQGEAALAIVAPEESPLHAIVLLDVGDRLSTARKLIARGTEALDASDAKRREETVNGTKLLIYEGVGRRQSTLVFFEKDSTMVLGSHLDSVKQVLAAFDGKAPCLAADSRAFSTVMQKCRGSDDEKPQILWYVDPIELMRGIGQNQDNVRMTLALLPVLGLDGVSAAGGTLTLATEKYDSIVHAHLLLETPRSGVVKMVAFRSGDSQPEPWVPADVASYMTLHWDFETTFTTLATVYDSFREEGALSEAIERRFFDRVGLDFEKEILPSLEGRVTYITWIERPVTNLRSRAALLAFKLKETEALEAALQKLPRKLAGSVSRQVYGGKPYYQTERPQGDEPAPAARPQPCFGILDGYLMLAVRPSIYQQVVVTLAGSKSLADELDFKLVASKIRDAGSGSQPAMVSFTRPEEGMRMLYQLAVGQQSRQRLERRAENSRFFRTLDTALKANPLPPFAVIRRYLAPSGSMVVDDETGIHYMRFTLRRQ